MEELKKEIAQLEKTLANPKLDDTKRKMFEKTLEKVKAKLAEGVKDKDGWYLDKNGDLSMGKGGKKYTIIYRDDKTSLYDLFEDGKKIGSNKSVAELKKKIDKIEIPKKAIGKSYVYGEDFGTHEGYGNELIEELKSLGFKVSDVKKSEFTIELDGRGKMFVNDNGGEFNTGNISTNSHISNIAYEKTSGQEKPSQLAKKIKDDYLGEFKDDEYDCDKIIAEAKAKAAKQKASAKKSAAKSPTTKAKDKIDAVEDKTIERVKSGEATEAEIKALIKKTQELLATLRNALKKIK